MLKGKIEKHKDSEDAMVEDENAGNYKGVFFGDDTEQKYYEHGAHFDFKDLCKRLEFKLRSLSPSRKGSQNDNLNCNLNIY